MNSALSPLKVTTDSAAAVSGRSAPNYGLPAAELTAAIQSACSRIAPLWPLQHFVAVNPFLGLSERAFADACTLAAESGAGDMLMPTRFYAEQYRRGRIRTADIGQALALTGSGMALEQCLAELHDARPAPADPEPPRWPTLADHLDAAYGSRWAAFVTDEISKWCAAYFDEGQASWRMPWRDRPLYAAWRRAAAFDRTPELAGISGFRRYVAGLPDKPFEAVAQIVAAIGIPAERWADFCYRQLLTIAGWSAWLRQKNWHGQPEQAGAAMLELLAIRLAYEHALLVGVAGPADIEAWQHIWQTQAQAAAEAGRATEIRHVLQTAYELATQRGLLRQLAASPAVAAVEPAAGKALQAVFCIDVRSEVYRRALEAVSGEIETLGFAGFFGFPIEYIGLGHHRGQAQCPVLLQPKYRIRESVADADVGDLRKILEKRWLHKRLQRLWKGFKHSAVSCFSYVEISGLSFAGKLLSDSLGLTRTVAKPGSAGLDRAVLGRIGPVITRQRGRLIAKGAVVETGIALGERIELARKALQGMSLTDRFARLVLLCGHGSSTVNNPYAAGLDCGACGGHSGEATARVAAAVLNDREVRAGLAGQGLLIPKETWFIAGLHDTATDTVSLFDLEQVPHFFSADLAQLQDWLEHASQLARRERAPGLGLAVGNAAGLLKAMAQRSRDWAQVRPEWGLAGNAAFVAAPRQRSLSARFDGRAFLHNYDYRQDGDGAILNLIMTAPMVVASWINLQYYASSVDNRRFGSGNKVLHNVVGTLGILEGNGGDLRTGLPWQSLHDGRNLRHEPLRLSVFIEAPAAMIEQVLEHQAGVRQLVENRWLHLLRIDPNQGCCYRYAGPHYWQPVSIDREEF
ncbi:YbcC family protein [Methylomonas koyamae]|uniref:YbcC family protein n=2 Tax=Methylomonas koyamae TaxID=702114 RepID=UPI001C32ADB1|nr:DUF2309 domain-containing protein [Methylomonas koyamae]BBL60191.1 UPF0753 protein [Methylomonas koyamae]